MSCGSVNGPARTQQGGPVEMPDVDGCEDKSASSPFDVMPDRPTNAMANSITSVMLLIERSLTVQRKATDARRDAAEKSQVEKEKQVVESMRKEADDAFSKAIVTGSLQIAGGAIQVGAAGMKAHSAAMKALASERVASSTAGAADKLALALSAKAEKLAGSAEILGVGKTLLDAGATGAAGLYESELKDEQANRTEHEQAAQAHGREAERASSFERELGELRTKTLERLEQILEGEQQARMGMLQRA